MIFLSIDIARIIIILQYYTGKVEKEQTQGNHEKINYLKWLMQLMHNWLEILIS